MSSMKTVTITGASGFVGEVVKKKFIDAGWSGVTTSRRGKHNQFINSKISQEKWQLGDIPTPTMLKSNGFVHLACDSIRPNEKMPLDKETLGVDIVGTKLLYEYWKKNKDINKAPFIFVSSQAAYSDATSTYGRIKFQCEQVFDKHATILRPGVLIKKGVITEFMEHSVS